MPAQSGGGGSAQNIRAGGAYYELAASDKLGPALDKAESKVKQLAKTIKQHSLSGGGLGQLLELTGKGGAIGLGIGVAQKAFGLISDEIKDWALGTGKFKAGLEASVASADRLSAKVAAIAADAREAAAAFGGNRAGRAGALSGGIAAGNRALDELLAERARARAAESRLYGGGGQDLRNIGVAFLGGLGAERDAAAKAVADIDARIAASRAALAGLAKDRAGALNPLADVRQLREAMDVATGPQFSGFVAKVMDLKRQFAGTGNDRLFDQLLGEAERTDAAVKIADATAALEEHLRAHRQAQLEIGKTADEIAILRAELAGVSADAIAAARRELLGGFGGTSGLSFLGQLLGAGAGTVANRARLGGLFDAVKGEFMTPLARQQFGIGDKVNDQVAILQAILDGKGRLPDAIGESLGRRLGTQ